MVNSHKQRKVAPILVKELPGAFKCIKWCIKIKANKLTNSAMVVTVGLFLFITGITKIANEYDAVIVEDLDFRDLVYR